MIKAAVIGHPVGHSLSPLIHSHWIAAHGFAGSYTAIDVLPEKLEETKAEILKKGGEAYAPTYAIGYLR